MAVYERETRVAAPLSEVWDFYSTVEGLRAVTPGWLNLRVERVVGPEGESDPGELAEGTRVTLSTRPFGVGPRRRWTSVVRERERGEGAAHFEDEMVDGPFPRWRHAHRFYGDGDETVLVDRVEYRLPGGRVVEAVSPLGRLGFEPMFAYRHRRTKELLEGPGGRGDRRSRAHNR